MGTAQFSSDLQQSDQHGGRLYGKLGDEIVGAVDYVQEDEGVAVVMIYVRPTYRHQGIARRMLQELEDRVGRRKKA